MTLLIEIVIMFWWAYASFLGCVIVYGLYLEHWDLTTRRGIMKVLFKILMCVACVPIALLALLGLTFPDPWNRVWVIWWVVVSFAVAFELMGVVEEHFDE